MRAAKQKREPLVLEGRLVAMGASKHRPREGRTSYEFSTSSPGRSIQAVASLAAWRKPAGIQTFDGLSG